MKIFIGTEPKTEIARLVLQHSIMRNCSAALNRQIEFIPMMGDGWRENASTKLGTGFSLLRWSIPEKCDYKGFAIYLDADILCLRDFDSLVECDVTYPNENVSTWCCYGRSTKIEKDRPTPETSVMLIDCAKAKDTQPTFDACVKYIDEIAKPGKERVNYFKIIRALKHKPLPQQIPNKFNRLNECKGGDVLLHYTKEPQQPWYSPDHPHRDLWEDALSKALSDGYIEKEMLKEAIEQYEPHTTKKRGTGMHPYWKKFC